MEIYCRYANSADFVHYSDITLVSSGQFVYFPDNAVVGVKVIMYGVHESIGNNTSEQNTIVRCYYCFHTDSDDIIIDEGRMTNNMYFNIYGNKASASVVHEWLNDDPEYYNLYDYTAYIPISSQGSIPHIPRTP